MMSWLQATCGTEVVLLCIVFIIFCLFEILLLQTDYLITEDVMLYQIGISKKPTLAKLQLCKHL